MKARLFIIGLLLSALVACTSKVKVPEPVEGPSPELSAIDSLIWQQPDSALAVLLNYLDDDGRDGACTVSTNETFDNHYAQLLASELLFKNNYTQTNRSELLQAVGYFDSLLLAADGVDARDEADTRGVSLRPDPRRDAPRASAKTPAFLAARAHYIYGVGYYERDSLIDACEEYLNALQMMERHFEEKVLVGHKARFMALTYNRLVELFSAQYMQEPAIYCGKQSLAYDKKAQSSPDKIANTYFFIAKQYGKLEEADSAAYYYKMALETYPDRKTLVYRDAVCLLALSEFRARHDTLASLDSLKSMMVQAANETEMLTRFMAIGSIYHDIGQYDSAKVYLEPVVGKYPKGAITAAIYLRDIALIEGDTVKANQYALILAEEGATAANNQARVSQLNDLFQNYLQEKQETALALERLEARRRNLWIGGVVALLATVGLLVAIVTRRSHKKRFAAQEAEAQRRLDEASQRLNETMQRHDEAERELQTKVEQAILHTKELLQQRAMSLYYGKEKEKLQRILNEFATAYPQASERLMATPNLKEQERNIIVLSFLHFRAKEIAELLGLSENTVLQYRSNIKKKMGSDPVSDLIG